MSEDTKKEKTLNLPAVLVIIDGVGVSPGNKSDIFSEVEMPFLDQMVAKYPVALLSADKDSLANNYFLLGGSGNLFSFFEKHSLRQLKVTEAEKYPYLSFYFNGKNSNAGQYENKVLIHGDLVDDYGAKPAMMTPKSVEVILKALKNNEADFLVVSFANLDLLRNSDNKKSFTKGVKIIDSSLKKIAKTVLNRDGSLFITSCRTGASSSRTAGKSALPFLMINKSWEGRTVSSGEVPGSDLSLMQISGTLSDVAPTIFKSIGVEYDGPGKSLID